jgi:hypothetical protein
MVLAAAIAKEERAQQEEDKKKAEAARLEKIEEEIRQPLVEIGQKSDKTWT